MSETPTETARRTPFEAPTGTEGSGRFAAYDTTLGRYVGGTHDSKAKAEKAGKAAGAATHTVVEV